MSLEVSGIKFSVVIPTYNRLRYLKACLKSVRDQLKSPYEIIVVDDGSHDGTREWIESQQDCILLVQSNQGPGAARNLGANTASGDYLAFLDSDDVWMPWSLSVFEEVILKSEHSKLVFASFVDFSELETLEEGLEQTEIEASNHPNFLSTSERGFFAGAGMMVIERNAFVGVGGFVEDRMNAEDHDLALRLGVEPGFSKVLHPVQVAHRLHDSNEMSSSEKSINGLKRLISREKAGEYPGGNRYKNARRRLISQHCRPQIISLSRSGNVKAAWHLLASTLGWNIRMGRVRFLLFALLLILRSLVFSRRVSTT